MKKSFLSIFLLMILTACGVDSLVSKRSAPAPAADKEALMEAPGGGEATGDEVLDVVHADTTTVPVVEKKIIRNATLRFRVKTYSESHSKINAIVTQYNGYIASENEVNRGYAIENRLVIRVPAEHFDGLVDGLVQIAEYVHAKNISATDVTEQYIDLQARLKAKKEVEARYVDILRQARTVPDILRVEAELRKVREEIESAEGRLRYLSHRVAYSTVTLTFYQDLEPEPIPGEDFFSKVVTALEGGWYFLKILFIGLVYLWPLWLMVFIVVFFIVRHVKKKKHLKK